MAEMKRTPYSRGSMGVRVCFEAETGIDAPMRRVERLSINRPRTQRPIRRTRIEHAD
jgi:hypothetical protein